MEYALHIVVLAGIFSALSISLDLLVGHSGLLSLAQAAFFGIGAYASAIITTQAGQPPIAAMLVGMAVSASISLLVSLPSLRLRDDYFVLATFAFQMIAFSIFNNWTGLTKGSLGISGIPSLALPGNRGPASLGITMASVLMALFVWSLSRRISRDAFGRVLHGIREDEVFVKSLGKNTMYFKVVIFAFSSALAALAGSLYAHYITYVDPTSFTVMDSLLIISMVIIGGAGSTYGPIAGATCLVVIPEVLRFVGLPGAIAANVRQILYGLLLVLTVVMRPAGMVGTRPLQ
jgi:branched-chain amino acid transport system permease protein